MHDALKRRCLYQWIDYPSFEKELAIVRVRVPEASARLAEQVTAIVQELRAADLYKVPGVSETIDWVTALVALDRDTLDADAVDRHARRRAEGEGRSRGAPRTADCGAARSRSGPAFTARVNGS